MTQETPNGQPNGTPRPDRFASAKSEREQAIAQVVDRALNRLAKWRTIFAGWQLGTRSKDDPECQAVRNAAEAQLIMRAELTAMTALLIRKNKFTAEEFSLQVAKEANHLSTALEHKFPGCQATDEGMSIDLKAAAAWMKDWKP